VGDGGSPRSRRGAEQPLDGAEHDRPGGRRRARRLEGLDWLSIAVACGYYDYQHMARDFRQFTGLTPNRLLETQSTSPEEILGVRHEFDLSFSVPMV
jgi:AraC-like DNA-binding protein